MTQEQFYALGTSTVLAADYITKPMNLERLVGEIQRTVAVVVAKRRQVERLAAGDFGVQVTSRLDRIEAQLTQVAQRHRSFLSELGLDLVRALIIAAALFAVLLLGVDDFVRKVLGG